MLTLELTPTAGKVRAPAKIERVLAALLEAPRTSRELQEFPVCDHVAHSTAHDLRRREISIVAERVEIRGYQGEPCWVARYSIPPEGRAFAVEQLELMRRRRRAAS